MLFTRGGSRAAAASLTIITKSTTLDVAAVLDPPLFTIEKIDVSSVKSVRFDIKLLGRSFTYNKNSNGPKIDSCCPPALISFQMEF